MFADKRPRRRTPTRDLERLVANAHRDDNASGCSRRARALARDWIAHATSEGTGHTPAGVDRRRLRVFARILKDAVHVLGPEPLAAESEVETSNPSDNGTLG